MSQTNEIIAADAADLAQKLSATAHWEARSSERHPQTLDKKENLHNDARRPKRDVRNPRSPSRVDVVEAGRPHDVGHSCDNMQL